MNFNPSLTCVFVINSFHKLFYVVPYFTEPSGHALADHPNREHPPVKGNTVTLAVNCVGCLLREQCKPELSGGKK